jgi:hypothetical protein
MSKEQKYNVVLGFEVNRVDEDGQEVRTDFSSEMTWNSVGYAGVVDMEASMIAMLSQFNEMGAAKAEAKGVGDKLARNQKA